MLERMGVRKFNARMEQRHADNYNEPNLQQRMKLLIIIMKYAIYLSILHWKKN